MKRFKTAYIIDSLVGDTFYRPEPVSVTTKLGYVCHISVNCVNTSVFTSCSLNASLRSLFISLVCRCLVMHRLFNRENLVTMRAS
jgi:hypothetical protein